MRECATFHALGAEVPAHAMVLRFLEALPSAPGTSLVLECGEEGAGNYLRAWGPAEVLALSEDAGTGSGQVRRSPVYSPPAPPAAEVDGVAAGRLVWDARVRTMAPGAPLSYLKEGACWAVQGLFQHHPDEGLVAHVRVLCRGPLPAAVIARDRVGTRWATALGAVYEPWVPGTRASTVAIREWRARRAVRFHSGEGPTPSPDRLASPWVVPPSLSPVPRPAPAWRLGWPWSGGASGLATDREMLRHLGVIGMTGSGKTQYLAHLAAEATRLGRHVSVFDLHGDLGPAVLSRLDVTTRGRVIVVDGSRPWGAGRAGIDVLSRGDGGEGEDLVVAEVLSALRPTGGMEEEFWGPRLERVLGTVVRAVWETNGNLADVAALLHDPQRQAETLGRGSAHPYVRSFLEGLPALHRRQPDYLASSQNRISLVALSNVVRALVAPGGKGVDVARAVGEGRGLLLHLPKGVMGEGPSLFTANLLLSRIFLTLLRREGTGEERVRSLVLLDEAQNFSPQLLRALLETGRKFGVATVFATQSLERLEGLVGESLLGTVGSLLLLRTPQPSASKAVAMTLGRYLPDEAREALERTLASLPDHTALVRAHGTPGISSCLLPAPFGTFPTLWEEASEASSREFGTPESEPRLETEEAAMESVLLEAVMAEAGSRAFRPEGPSRAGAMPAPGEVDRAFSLAVRRGWVVPRGEGQVSVTPAGWARLGLREESGAPRESDEHRRLVMSAFRIFARRGVRLEIPLQGRFDLRLPDAVARLLPGDTWRALPPIEIGRALDQLRGGWLWQLGRGRDVHVEAEVSSVHDPKRLARSLGKARRAGAYLLFLAGTREGGRRLRAFLRNRGAGAEIATVWVLEGPTLEQRWRYLGMGGGEEACRRPPTSSASRAPPG